MGSRGAPCRTSPAATALLRARASWQHHSTGAQPQQCMPRTDGSRSAQCPERCRQPVRIIVQPETKAAPFRQPETKAAPFWTAVSRCPGNESDRSCQGGGVRRGAAALQRAGPHRVLLPHHGGAGGAGGHCGEDCRHRLHVPPPHEGPRGPAHPPRHHRAPPPPHTTQALSWPIDGGRLCATNWRGGLGCLLSGHEWTTVQG